MNVVITGGAGSLGTAFVRYLHTKHDITVVDNNEWACAALQAEFPNITVLMKDYEKYRFDENPADVVIHCAAYKHVNLGESNPHSFIENNVTKTGKLFALCQQFNVDILFISTDKAVEPISTYGFTKALGERLAWHYGGYVARLGNILNSSGSVVPVWEQAIADKKPIRITDENMTRYLIEDIDAVAQIWKGYVAKKKLIIPIMDEPVRLLDILQQVLARHGYPEAADYEPGALIIGMRPGEKLHEKLRWDHEIMDEAPAKKPKKKKK